MTDQPTDTVPERFRSTSAPTSPAHVGLAPLRESLEFAPGHFWTYSETPYESTIKCQCGWGWRWNQPWGGRDMALATYRDHARNETGWSRRSTASNFGKGVRCDGQTDARLCRDAGLRLRPRVGGPLWRRL